MSDNLTIYKYTSQTSGKSYIGQTNNLERRSVEHQQSSSGCVIFSSAVQKYGWDDFVCEVLAINLSAEQANVMEQDLILTVNTITPLGYNIRSGGENSSIHESTKQKISKSLSGRKRSKEAVNKTASWHRGRAKDPQLVAKKAAKRVGQTRTEDQRHNISAALTGRTLSEAHKNNIALSNKNRPVETKKCPKCGKVGKGSAMNRWHFDNCRSTR